ncbi:MAG: hypothetical protein JWO57_1542 [Pseudonocardiales bacterium]|nr:hypothetical protein [Pseudonocardiales bacterium]
MLPGRTHRESGANRMRSAHVFMNEMSMQADYAIVESGSLAACDIDELNRWLRRDLHNLDGRYVTSLELITERRVVRFPRN